MIEPTREEFVKLVKDLYEQGKISKEMLRDLAKDKQGPKQISIYLTEEEIDAIIKMLEDLKH